MVPNREYPAINGKCGSTYVIDNGEYEGPPKKLIGYASESGRNLGRQRRFLLSLCKVDPHIKITKPFCFCWRKPKKP